MRWKFWKKKETKEEFKEKFYELGKKVVEPEPVSKTETKEESKPLSFKCDICGREFATERGLKTHKSRSHKNQ